MVVDAEAPPPEPTDHATAMVQCPVEAEAVSAVDQWLDTEQPRIAHK